MRKRFHHRGSAARRSSEPGSAREVALDDEAASRRQGRRSIISESPATGTSESGERQPEWRKVAGVNDGIGHLEPKASISSTTVGRKYLMVPIVAMTLASTTPPALVVRRHSARACPASSKA